eukprot:TRINITY_DN14638_c0_g1_i1.p1 TRINITY_DN14638_c0_g1~~TRINITY_DN14638_c0_g1_i1.p1  ORF type:complete len:298 (+),score=54.69 TRINITY_DN14638_c0_g1_i1:86-979(+)
MAFNVSAPSPRWSMVSCCSPEQVQAQWKQRISDEERAVWTRHVRGASAWAGRRRPAPFYLEDSATTAVAIAISGGGSVGCNDAIATESCDGGVSCHSARNTEEHWQSQIGRQGKHHAYQQAKQGQPQLKRPLRQQRRVQPSERQQLQDRIVQNPEEPHIQPLEQRQLQQSQQQDRPQQQLFQQQVKQRLKQEHQHSVDDHLARRGTTAMASVERRCTSAEGVTRRHRELRAELLEARRERRRAEAEAVLLQRHVDGVVVGTPRSLDPSGMSSACTRRSSSHYNSTSIVSGIPSTRDL